MLEVNELGQKLCLAIIKENEAEVRQLLVQLKENNRADVVNYKYYYSSSYTCPLHLAAISYCEKISKLLIENGADVNAQNSSGDTPLHIAVEFGDEKIYELLTQNGANTNIKNYYNKTPPEIVCPVKGIPLSSTNDPIRRNPGAITSVTNNLQGDILPILHQNNNSQPNKSWNFTNFLSHYPVASMLILASAAFSTLYFSGYGKSMIENLGSFCKVCIGMQKSEAGISL
ncbi:MAG: serine/threonine-protein phosphatase 6 regulatory ankyrin repeat subunit A-like [Candidatus Midichloriaceae bacterium]|jgi:hypothetical protein|nr:serine/threonine-protein phosphatase 6 regulatory ankyrin repeat subunit A-like [Candidatus Midichloriaceae bacterium]